MCETFCTLSSQIALVDGSGFKYIALDATEYHTYRIETVSGSSAYNFYIDNIQQASASARSVTGANYLQFGDITGGANASVDITALEFSQIPEPGTTGLISLFAGGVIFVRRVFKA